jgi:hypothetical protein
MANSRLVTTRQAKPTEHSTAFDVLTSRSVNSRERDRALARATADAAALCDPTPAVVAPPPAAGPGSWAGAPSAVLVDGTYYLAYRLRRPLGKGRGVANVVARSPDGVAFEIVAVVEKDSFGAESLERPALAVTDDGTWRLYVSCATPGSSHWRIDLVEASSPERLAEGWVRTVLPGSREVAVKDPVVVHHGGRWHLWASWHPLTDPEHTDRMTTAYAISEDGVRWFWQGTALTGRPGHWDERGARVSAVLLGGTTPVAYYDGRATAEQNCEEQTGVAVAGARFGAFRAIGRAPVARSRHRGGGLRYVSVVPLPDGSRRLYYEATRADGAHELLTQLQPAAS